MQNIYPTLHIALVLILGVNRSAARQTDKEAESIANLSRKNILLLRRNDIFQIQSKEYIGIKYFARGAWPKPPNRHFHRRIRR